MFTLFILIIKHLTIWRQKCLRHFLDPFKMHNLGYTFEGHQISKVIMAYRSPITSYIKVCVTIVTIYDFFLNL